MNWSPTMVTAGRRRRASETELSPTRLICSALTMSVTTSCSMRSWMTSSAAVRCRPSTMTSSSSPGAAGLTAAGSPACGSSSGTCALASEPARAAPAAAMASVARTATLNDVMFMFVLARSAMTPGDPAPIRVGPAAPLRRRSEPERLVGVLLAQTERPRRGPVVAGQHGTELAALIHGCDGRDRDRVAELVGRARGGEEGAGLEHRDVRVVGIGDDRVTRVERVIGAVRARIGAYRPLRERVAVREGALDGLLAGEERALDRRRPGGSRVKRDVALDLEAFVRVDAVLHAAVAGVDDTVLDVDQWPNRASGPSESPCVPRPDPWSPFDVIQVRLRIVGADCGAVSSASPPSARASAMLSPSMQRLPSVR